MSVTVLYVAVSLLAGLMMGRIVFNLKVVKDRHYQAVLKQLAASNELIEAGKIKPPPRASSSIKDQHQTRLDAMIAFHEQAIAGNEGKPTYRDFFNSEGDVVRGCVEVYEPEETPEPLAYTIDHMIEESEKIQDVIALENPKLWAANQAARTYKKTMGDDNRERFYK